MTNTIKSLYAKNMKNIFFLELSKGFQNYTLSPAFWKKKMCEREKLRQ